jgi:GMP synthase-like glutamine amidotransferase
VDKRAVRVDGAAMQIGILEAGEPPAKLAEEFGRYDSMFARLLGPGFTTVTYDVQACRFPARAADHAAYIVSGSPAGVYEDHRWIEPLKAFLGDARGKAKLVGICFGHQIMAETFGGRVEKSERGWGIGLHRYDILAREPWMDDAASVAIPVSHQDQIVRQPPGTRVIGASPFAPFGMLSWESFPALSMQCHPEFEPAFVKALIETRRERLPDPDAAIASLDQPNDRERVAGWMRAFLRG